MTTGRPNVARAPWPLVGMAALGLTFLALPIIGLLQRMPWSAVPDLLGGTGVADAVRVSAVVSVAATVLCVVLGLPVAWVLARVQFRGKRFARALVLLPMVLPPVVGGTALPFALRRRGLVGSRLDDWFGVTLPFTTAGAIVAATFVSLPFFVVTVEAALGGLDERYEETASTLGANPLFTFFRVTLPLVRPAIIAGAALSWARALGEFGATITFAGDSPGRTRTLPLEIFVALETQPERALALSLVLVSISLLILVALRGRWLGARP
ncbi:MAG: molybdate ABC transporter permease subunit [Acidimicrobiales bacterium]